MRQLSRYLVLGPVHSGKTTFILNHEGVHASLKPVLTKGAVETQRLFNEGGQVWTTTNAMWVELSGACLYADTLIEGLGDLVDEYGPLQGIIVVLDAASLTAQAIEEQHVLYDMERLNEVLLSLSVLLKKPCPIYIILSQLDKIAGFQAFFKDLSTETVNQPWGFPLSDKEQADKVTALTHHFSGLQQQLLTGMMDKLDDITDLERNRLIHQFPNQMDALKKAVLKWMKSLLTLAFQPQSLWIKGIYLVGYSPYFHHTTQLYHPVKSTLKKTYPFEENEVGQLPATVARVETNSSQRTVHYFAAALFGIFESNNFSWLARFKAIRKLTIVKLVSAAIWLVGGGYALTYYYHTAMQTLTMVRSVGVQEKQLIATPVAGQQPITIRLTHSVQRADDIEQALQKLQAQRGFPMEKGALTQKLDTLYDSALEQAIWPNLKSILFDAIQKPNQPPEALYRLIKAGLMLQRIQPWDEAFLSAHLNHIAEYFLLQPELKQRFSQHVARCVKQQANRTILSDAEYQTLSTAIARARTRLQTSPPEQLIMFALNSEFVGKAYSYPFKYWDRKQPTTIFDTSLDTVACLPQYTAEHFGAIYQDLIPRLVMRWIEGRDSVVHATTPIPGTEQDHHLLIKAVRAAWLNTYANSWQSQYSQLKLKEANNLKQLHQLFDAIKESDTSLQVFVSTLIQHTSWPLLQKQLNTWHQADRTLVQYYLTRHFEKLYDLEYRSDRQPYAQFEKRISLPVKTLCQYLQPVMRHGNPEKAAFLFTKQRFVYQSQISDPLTQLFAISNTLPEPLNHWVGALARQSRDLLLKNTQHYLNQVWHDQVFKRYEATIEGRYPVFQASQRDIALSDFSEFFGPKGVIIHYIENYLLPFMDAHATRWQMRQKDGGSISLASTVLTELERAQVIRKLFFPAHQPTPQVKFTLKPMLKDAQLNANLQYGGRLYDGKESGSTLPDITWPIWPTRDTVDDNAITIQLHDASGAQLAHTITGTWAWFRLLDRADCDRNAIPIHFTIAVNPYTVHYQLWPQQKEHPFIKGIVERFRCPARLTI